MFWKILLGVALLLFLLFLTPVRLYVQLQGEGELSVRAHAWCFSLFRHPKKEKPFRPVDYSPRALAKKAKKQARLQAKQQKKKERHLKKSKKKSTSSPTATAAVQKKPSSLGEKIRLIGTLLREIPGPFFRYARIDLHALELRIATGDAATTAIAYGAACPAVAFLLDGLHQFSNLHLHHPDRILVVPDFEGQKTTAKLDLRLQLRLWQLLAVGLKALLRIGASRAAKTQPNISQKSPNPITPPASTGKR
jgi:hypothetical protein